MMSFTPPGANATRPSVHHACAHDIVSLRQCSIGDLLVLRHTPICFDFPLDRGQLPACVCECLIVVDRPGPRNRTAAFARSAGCIRVFVPRHSPTMRLLFSLSSR